METPFSMVADNDEATGMIVETISHSVFWPETAIFIFEDDPQDGYDHVDGHRTICLVVSPWARRGVTSHVHYDDASIYRTIELILGLEPMSRYDADAAPLYDLFTSTPDYAPYEAIPRTWPVEWNPEEPSADARGRDGERFAGDRDADERRRLDLSAPDQTGGLGPLLWRMVRGGSPPPYAKIIPGWADPDDAPPDR
ncbi:MAG: hypothetical protein HYY06_31945 [Deltaproteobacteria bacterium]|nr:hypothetical protein [Deltaproteobacteria bacterium]